MKYYFKKCAVVWQRSTSTYNVVWCCMAIPYAALLSLINNSNNNKIIIINKIIVAVLRLPVW